MGQDGAITSASADVAIKEKDALVRGKICIDYSERVHGFAVRPQQAITTPPQEGSVTGSGNAKIGAEAHKGAGAGSVREDAGYFGPTAGA